MIFAFFLSLTSTTEAICLRRGKYWKQIIKN